MLPIDCQNLLMDTQELAFAVCCGKKTMHTNFSDLKYLNVWTIPTLFLAFLAYCAPVLFEVCVVSIDQTIVE